MTWSLPPRNSLHRHSAQNTVQRPSASPEASPSNRGWERTPPGITSGIRFVNMGHLVLASRDADESSAEALAYVKEGLERLARRGAANPFLFGVPFIWCSNNLVVAALTQLRAYSVMTHDSHVCGDGSGFAGLAVRNVIPGEQA